MQVRDKAVYYAYRSFDPESPVEVPAGSLAGATSAGAPACAHYGNRLADEAEINALASAEAQALLTGAGTRTAYVPVGAETSRPIATPAAAHVVSTVTAAGLQWTLFRVPV